MPLPLQKLTDQDRAGFSGKKDIAGVDASVRGLTRAIESNTSFVNSLAVVISSASVIQAESTQLGIAKQETGKAMKVEADTELKKPWLSSVKKSLGSIKDFVKPEEKSEEEQRKKEEEKAKKIAEREKKWQERTKQWRSDLKDSLVKGATDNPIVNFLKDHWGKLLIGLSLFFLKPEQMKKAWDSLVKGMKWLIKEGPGILKGIWDTLEKWVPKVFDGIVTVSGWIKSLIDAVIGRKVTDEDVKEAEDRQKELREKAATPGGLSGEEQSELGELDEKLAAGSQFRKDHAGFKKTGKRQGGLLGEGGGMWEKAKGIGALAILFVGALALLTKSFVPIMAALKLFGGGLRLGGRGLRSFGRQANRIGVPKKGGLIANQRRNIEAKRLREQRANRTLKPKPTKPLLGSPKPTGAPKITATPTSGMSTTASPRALPPKTPKITAKPSTGGMSTTATGASKMGKWASKFPKLAKGMKFLTKLPGPVGKAFTVGPIIMALASGADKKTIIPMIGGMLGGIGGGTLGALLGGMIGVAGGPLAIITGILGGVMGGMLGDSLGMGIAQWLVGDTVDALPMDWMNNLLNGGKGPDEGGDLKQTPAGAGAGAGGEAKPPMTKNQFLQSERYKSQMRDESGVVRGESTAGKQMAYEDYLKEEENAPAIKKAVKKAQKDLKTANRLPSPIKEQRFARINKAIDANPNPDAILRGLKPRELKLLGRDSSQGTKVHISEASMKKSTGLSGSDDFMGVVTPTQKIAGQRALDAESAKLSGSSNGGTSVINNNTTNNYGGGGKDTAIVTEKSASNSKLVSYLDDF